MKAYLAWDEVARMECAATNVRDRVLARLLSHSGCRISEALSIAVDDIDFAAGTVRIVHLKTRNRVTCPGCGGRLGRFHFFCPKCGSKVNGATAEQQAKRRQRVLPVDGETLALLKEFIERGGPVERDGRLVLFGINRHRAWQVVRECAQKAGLGKLVNPDTGKPRGVSPHRLRDAFAVHAMKVDDSGEGLRLLQKNLS